MFFEGKELENDLFLDDSEPNFDPEMLIDFDDDDDEDDDFEFIDDI